MKTKLVRIGNSRGIRIPKPLLEQAGLSDEVELRLVDSRIVIESASRPRAGWADAASNFHARGGDQLLDEVTPTDFDESGWDW
jgi:antitoxin MazE